MSKLLQTSRADWGWSSHVKFETWLSVSLIRLLLINVENAESMQSERTEERERQRTRETPSFLLSPCLAEVSGTYFIIKRFMIAVFLLLALPHQHQ